MNNNTAVMEFLQKALGYAMSGLLKLALLPISHDLPIGQLE
jgi:hypothetical protein